MLTMFIGILIGIIVSFQTAINSRLRGYLGVPFLSSFISFSGGTLFLLILAKLSNEPLTIEPTTLLQTPWWLWIGGLMGMVSLTANILLFAKLGSVQTAIIPLLGQVIMGILIDTFGWFYSPKIDLNLIRILGISLVFLGIFCTVVMPIMKKTKSLHSQSEPHLLLWRFFGIFAGMLLAAQTAINAELGRVLHSSVQAAFVSFAVGGSGLFLVVLFYEKSFSKLKNAIGKGKPWWVWFGGCLGALFIFGSITLVPQIGTGGAVVLALLGLISGSLLVDKFGFFGAQRKVIIPIQLVGLGILISGVMLIQLIRI
ncbi:DMT family transporter [Rodentibacter sp. Ppn85]|uniref:DMT family transporter n=1 Tax=Rodentibacter sp. Ppn85 TaxID=1908525 RepID=UPI000985D01A|nr:DMT family transporter [Rodentibacter sp. Ppn85]OOF64399.1 orotate transporter [Rodentibacter sp. Ppn85]